MARTRTPHAKPHARAAQRTLNARLVALQEFERHFDLMADKLLNDAVLLVANRRRPRRIRPGPDSSDSAAAASTTTTSTTATATTSAEAMDVEAAKVDTIDDVDSNDDNDDVDSGGEEASTAYRLAEVEFYYYYWGPGLRDVFTHRDEAQRESGRWYFHRDVSDRTKYRTGNFKGLDITFGNGGRDVRTNTHTRHTRPHTLTRHTHTHAHTHTRHTGECVRRNSDSCDRESERRQAFRRPLREWCAEWRLILSLSLSFCVLNIPLHAVNQLLAHAGVKEIKDLVALPSFDFEVGNSGAQVLRRNQLYLHFPAHPVHFRRTRTAARTHAHARNTHTHTHAPPHARTHHRTHARTHALAHG